LVGGRKFMADLRRRKFIALLGGAATAWPLAARAQQPDRMRRIGVLLGLPEHDPGTEARMAGFRQEIERLGWSESRNLRIDYRFAHNGTPQDRARELIALQPDAILAQGTPVVAALQQETRTIPIVFVHVTDQKLDLSMRPDDHTDPPGALQCYLATLLRGTSLRFRPPISWLPPP
jgi:ABC-type uncharacterized transport system substrate-binding protein